MRIEYTDERGVTQQLVRSSWDFPDTGNFRALRSVAQSAAEAVTTLHVKRKSTPVTIASAEQAEAARKGPGALEKLYAARRAITDNMIAYAELQTLAVRESGPSTGLRAIEASFPVRVRALARVEPFNPTNVALDGRLLDALARKTGLERTQFMLELKDGQHPATARAILRAAEATPELLPMKLDEPALAGIAEAVARRESPTQMAEIDEEARAAAIARAACSAAVRVIQDSVTLSGDEVRDALGDSFERLHQAPSMDDANWAEFLGAPRNHPALGAPGEESVERAARHLAAANSKVAA